MTAELEEVGTLVLAAGAGQRYGMDKRQARMASGRTVLEQVLETFGTVGPMRLVLAAGDRDWAQAIQKAHPELEIVLAPPSPTGMGHSLAAGARGLTWKGCLIALADMPFVRRDTAIQVAEAVRQGRERVIPCYRGRRGHPVGFGRLWYASLQLLSGDRGARTVLEAAGEPPQELAVEDPGILEDLDRPADLARLERRQSQATIQATMNGQQTDSREQVQRRGRHQPDPNSPVPANPKRR